MKVKKKNYIITLICMFIFACLLSCGIFALADSVKFKLGINLKPSVYFALSINIDNAGEQFIFDNRTTSANPVEDWATVKNLTLTLANNALSTAQNVELKVYNYNASKLMSFEVYDTAGGVLSTQQSGVKNITYGNYGVLNLKSIAVVDGIYSFKMVAEIYDQAIPKYDVIINNVYADEVYKNDNYTKVFLPENNYSIAVRSVEIAGVSTTNYSYEAATGLFEIASAYVTGNVEITTKLVPLVWDGSVASEFSGGNGTENSPFEIRTGAELAYLAQVINSQATTVKSLGASYTITAGAEGVYFEQQNDIYLNDETFEFQADTGLVKVSDGTNLAFLGTSMLGSNVGLNAYFDNTASVPGVFYPSKTSITSGSYDGIINPWITIGGLNSNFNGVYDGDGNCVRGIFINNDNAGYRALFGYSNDSIKNLALINGYIYCTNLRTGGICAYNNGTVDSCYNNTILIGPEATSAKYDVGGVVGINYGLVSNCYNDGLIIRGYSGCGGVCGYNGYMVVNCYNNGIVSGACRQAGGIVGSNGTGSVTGSGGAVSYSFNMAPISVTELYYGSVVGSLELCTINNCFYLTGTAEYGAGYDTNLKQYTNTGCNQFVNYIDIHDALSLSWNFTSVWVYNKSLNNGLPYLKVFEYLIL